MSFEIINEDGRASATPASALRKAMMLRRTSPVVVALLSSALCACAGSHAGMHRVASTEVLPPDCRPCVLPVEMPAPKGSVLLASARYGDTRAAVTCSERWVKELLRIQACRSGANAVKIVSESRPNPAGGCYSVQAEFYKLDATTLPGPIERIVPQLEVDETIEPAK
jgi:hypothetical protein